MKLYLAAGQYVGTQVEAKRLDKGFEQVDVPTDKEGLIAYLNKHAGTPVAPYPVDDGADLLAPEPRKIGKAAALGMGYAAGSAPKGDAYAELSKAWQSGADVALTPPDVDGIVEKIMSSKGYVLKRYASAVAQAFNRLAGD